MALALEHRWKGGVHIFQIAFLPKTRQSSCLWDENDLVTVQEYKSLVCILTTLLGAIVGDFPWLLPIIPIRICSLALTYSRADPPKVAESWRLQLLRRRLRTGGDTGKFGSGKLSWKLDYGWFTLDFLALPEYFQARYFTPLLFSFPSQVSTCAHSSSNFSPFYYG